uniref:BAR domain-containing protein n=1 Tax=Corethron hystrix TaxID=216773 RepID=A0A7S1FM56_9STRA
MDIFCKIAEDTPLQRHLQSSKSAYSKVNCDIEKNVSLALNKNFDGIVNYLDDWENFLEQRLTKELKYIEEYRVEMKYYQNKLNNCRKKAEVSKKKGKEVDIKIGVKIARNEKKLSEAKTSYDRLSKDMVVFMNKVSQEAWKKIFPVVLKIVQFEFSYYADKNKINKILEEVTIPSFKCLVEDDKAAKADGKKNGGIVANMGFSAKYANDFLTPLKQSENDAIISESLPQPSRTSDAIKKELSKANHFEHNPDYNHTRIIITVL